MNALLNLQLKFSHSLLTKRNDIATLLNNETHSGQNAAISIYQNAYQTRLQETLRNDYPMLNWLLGPESFNQLALEYIEESPSFSYSLGTFGQHLGTFLMLDPVYNKQPYLAELANFEWTLVNAFDQADTDAANEADMGSFEIDQWPQLTMKLHASVKWITLNWNLLEIYQVFATESRIPDLVRYQSSKQCLIWRKQYSPHFRLVDAREWFALKIMENSNFAELCQTLADLDDSDEHAALNAATYLKSWLSAGLIESVDSPQIVKH